MNSGFPFDDFDRACAKIDLAIAETEKEKPVRQCAYVDPETGKRCITHLPESNQGKYCRLHGKPEFTYSGVLHDTLSYSKKRSELEERVCECGKKFKPKQWNHYYCCTEHYEQYRNKVNYRKKKGQL